MRFMTLHIRLTRDCNAHCSYCSSAGAAEGRMSEEDFRKSIDFIADKILPRIHQKPIDHLTVEYLGGEILLVPESELARNVSYARSALSRHVRVVRDGAQSNLIGSPRRVLALSDLFDGRVGTSWEGDAGQRQVKGSSDLYKALATRSIKALREERGVNPGRVIVVDSHSAHDIPNLVRDAIDQGHDLVLRPVFAGGSDDLSPLTPENLAAVMMEAYQIWAADPRVSVEPFQSLRQRRLDRESQRQTSRGCPFQSDCALKSLSLDPDGSLHVCQEMADAGAYPLGNGVRGVFDERTWRFLARRTAHLSDDCVRCAWREECGGGCMNEAIQHHGDPFAKTELCPVWKALFALIESGLERQKERK